MGLRLIYLKDEGAMEDIECVFESMSSRGSIYISNITAAQNLSLLQGTSVFLSRERYQGSSVGC